MAEVLEGLSKALGDRLKARRDSAHLNQADVASLVGLSRASISNIENGRQPVTLQTLLLLAQALHVPLKDLVPDEKEIAEKAPAVPRTEDEQRFLQQIVGATHGNP